MNAGRQLARYIAIAREARRRAERDVTVARFGLEIAAQNLARTEKKAREADAELNQLMVRAANLKGTRPTYGDSRPLGDTYSFDDVARALSYGRRESVRGQMLDGVHARSDWSNPGRVVPHVEPIPQAAGCASLWDFQS